MKPLQALLPIALLAATLASVVALVWARYEARAQFALLTQLQAQRDRLNIEFGRLELEQATWADPARVERVARRDLGMVNPQPADIQLIRP